MKTTVSNPGEESKNMTQLTSNIKNLPTSPSGGRPDSGILIEYEKLRRGRGKIWGEELKVTISRQDENNDFCIFLFWA